MTRAVALDRFRQAAKVFIEAHRLDEGGDPLQSGHGGLVTLASIKARDECARLLAELETWDGIIEIIDTPVPPNIREHDGRMVVESYAGTLTVRADAGDCHWLRRKVRISLAPVDFDQT